LYEGTTIDGLPHGFGRLRFNKGINYLKPIYYKNNPKNVNSGEYLFYEGEFKFGKMDGRGKLRFMHGFYHRECILMGEF